jgi:hypothetical protein
MGLVGALVAAPAPARAGDELPDPVRFGVAVESGDLRSARAWLKAGLPPDFVADRIGTGLMIAAWEGNIPMMELFHAHGADVNATNALNEQAIMHAAWKGHAEAVRWLLARGAHLNRDGLQWSALHYAVFAGRKDVALFLIEHGADVNARSTNGSSPLMMAAREGQEELAQVLLGRGADPSIKNDWGDDALAWAIRNGHARIGKMVAPPEQFAAAARAPERFGPPSRSLPPEDRLEAIYRRMREAEAQGYLTTDLEREYAAALREMREQWAGESSADATARRGTPAALEIRARRDAPGHEEALLIYERDAAVPPAEDTAGAARP